MRPRYLILGLVALLAVLSIWMSGDPEQSQRLSQMYRDVALTGETREAVLLLLAVGIGGFVLYLTMSRR